MGLQKEINANTNSIELVYTWYEPYHKIAFIFLIVWDLFNIALWYPIYLPLTHGEFGFPKNFFAFCCLFVLVPAPSYWMVVHLINRTTVHLGRSEVRIINGPLPSWRRNHSFAIKDIKYISIEELHIKPVTEMAWNIKTDQTCHIKATMRNGQTRYIFLNIENREDARVVLLRIRSWLKSLTRTELPELGQRWNMLKK